MKWCKKSHFKEFVNCNLTLNKFIVNVCWQVLMQKLINSRGPIEDPSPIACASRSLITGQTDGLLSYKTTSSLISSSSCCFSDCDIDSHLLGLLKVYHFFRTSFFWKFCLLWSECSLLNLTSRVSIKWNLHSCLYK